MSAPERAPRVRRGTAETLTLAQRGDRDADARLRELCDELPALWDCVGDLALQAREALIAQSVGPSTTLRVAVARSLERQHADLAGAECSPLESLLVDHIISCGLDVHYTDAQIAQGGERTLAQADHWRRRQDSAHRRYLAAIRALAVVRRLQLPALQLNIAERQVNVASSSPCGEVRP